MTRVYDLQTPEAGLNMAVDEERDISPFHDGGVMKRLLVVGVGEDTPHSGDKVTLRYTAYNGDVMAPEYIFDSSERDKKDFEYICGRGRVLRGFDLGIMSMKHGERAVFILEPAYAFGPSGAPPKVLPNVKVTFDVQILKFECQDVSPDKDKTLLKKMLHRGKGWNQPSEGTPVKIYIKGTYDDVVFLEKEAEFRLGEGSSRVHQIPDFVEGFLGTFRKGEISRIFFASKHAYGEKGCPELGVPPNKDLTFIMELLDVGLVQDVWEMNNEDKFKGAIEAKEKGNNYFKNGEYKLALKFYERMLDYVEYDLCMQGEEEEQRHKMMILGYLNKAQVYLKLGMYNETREVCDKVIENDEQNVKAYYRRGQSRVHTGDWADALADFKKVLELEPNNLSAKKQILVCKQKVQDTSGRERDLARRMMADLGKMGGNNEQAYGSGMDNIGDWDNTMAEGMMTLEQEREAFVDDMPSSGGNNHGHED